jgi:hypothetical protein
MSNATNWPFRGLCLGVPRQQDFDVFKRLISEVLPRYGCNALVLLIRYRYQFASHPRVSDEGALTPAQAAEIAALCRQNGIRLIPKMNLLGHQSGMKPGTELGLLRAYPEFDETPDLPEVRYCRSLCPRHPRVQEVVFDLIDEMLDAFQADAIHVGLDEVFEIGHCPRCKGTPNADLFADWVNALHAHIVGKRQADMLIWGDRLLDAASTAYGEWEASANHTWEEIARIPRDILICDWHYEERDDGYPSIPFFAEQGFRLVVCPWKNLKAARLLLDDAAAHRSQNLLGVLVTSWCDAGAVARYLCDEDALPDETPRLVGESFKLAMTMTLP